MHYQDSLRVELMIMSYSLGTFNSHFITRAVKFFQSTVHFVFRLFAAEDLSSKLSS